ncbi:hypothetical protein EDB87DRAFT_1579964 [Lactarius vividus]|nr:hypothetical protein EDB87DRAFT_1579964 [Lactarius vividus]
MVYIPVPPLLPGVHKSDYAPDGSQREARPRDNSGSKEPMHVPQLALESNWPGAGNTGPSGKKTKKETVVMVRDEDDEEEESDKSKIPTPLGQALAAGFTHNSTNHNVVASAGCHPVADETRTHACSGCIVRVERGDIIRTRRTIHAENQTSRNKTTSNESEFEIIANAPYKLQRVPKAKSQSQPHARPQSRHKPRRSTQQHRTSTPPAIHTRQHTTGLLLTTLPEPSRTEIAIPPRALSHLHSSPDPPDPVRKLQKTQQYVIRQGFCYEGGAVGVHGLLATSPAAEPSLASDSCTGATTTNSTPASASASDPDDLQDTNLDLDLDLDISMDLEDGPADADGDVDTRGFIDDVVPPLSPPCCAPQPRRWCGCRPLSHKPKPSLSFDLASPNHGGEGSIAWRAGNIFGGALAMERSTCPCLVACPTTSLASSGTTFGGVQPSRATDEDNEEEEDVMGTLFENTSDDDFVLPSGLGKGKGRAVVMGGVVESSESVAAVAGSRMRRKTCKEPEDEVLGENNDSDDESGCDDEMHPAVVIIKRAPRGTNVLPPLQKYDAPTRDAMYVDQDVNRQQCLFCGCCIEKRYPQLTFDRSAKDFECPACCSYCNCSLFSRKRGGVFDASGSVTAVFAVSGEPLGKTAAIAKTLACVYWETVQDMRAARVPSGSEPQPSRSSRKDEGEGGDGGQGQRGVDDADDGIWPGEYVVLVPSAQTETARITPEEVERAIGAPFSIGTPAA